MDSMAARKEENTKKNAEPNESCTLSIFNRMRGVCNQVVRVALVGTYDMPMTCLWYAYGAMGRWGLWRHCASSPGRRCVWPLVASKACFPDGQAVAVISCHSSISWSLDNDNGKKARVGTSRKDWWKGSVTGCLEKRPEKQSGAAKFTSIHPFQCIIHK